MDLIFTIDVIILMVLLSGTVWSVVIPEKRIWPPPARASWQYWTVWLLFTAVFVMSAVLMVFDWNSWIFTSQVRLIVGLPLAILGGSLTVWGIRTLGIVNTSGLANGFTAMGPYQFTRNPQYLGDICLLLGLSITANSAYLWIANFLLILVFLITPLSEEPWLTDQYGEAYKSYKRETPRFL